MRIQRYRTYRGAAKYAAEIKKKFPSVTTDVLPLEFSFAVRVTTPQGNIAWAGLRPRNYASSPFEHRIKTANHQRLD